MEPVRQSISLEAFNQMQHQPLGVLNFGQFSSELFVILFAAALCIFKHAAISVLLSILCLFSACDVYFRRESYASCGLQTTRTSK